MSTEDVVIRDPTFQTEGVTTTKSGAKRALDVADPNNPDLTGAWAYKGGVSGTVSVPDGARVIGLTAIATSGAGTVVINGGDAVPVPQNAALALQPAAQLTGPFDVVFTSTDAYFVEYLT